MKILGLGKNFWVLAKILGLGEKNFLLVFYVFAFAFCMLHLHFALPVKNSEFPKKFRQLTDTQQQQHTQNQWPPLLHYGLDRKLFMIY